jgi:hypothetical protein
MTNIGTRYVVAALLGGALYATSIPATATPALAQQAATHDTKPSRAAEKGCAWEKFSDAKLGLDAWVQRCTYGKRKIEFVVVKNSLAQRWSDGGEPEPVVDVLDLKPGEAPEAGLRRLFAERTDKKLAAQCVLAPFHDKFLKTPAGVKRYTFVPNAAYAKVVKAKEVPGDMPDPACGDWGDMPDGIQYWEAQPQGGVAKVLFVRYGQDTPLFDEATLRAR